MKKAIIAGTSIATMALMAMPALAFDFCHCPTPDPCPCPTHITVTNLNDSHVGTANISVSNSGLNGTSQFGKINIAKIKTGDSTAVAAVQNQVGINQTMIEPISNGSINVNNVNLSEVRTLNAAVSNTGGNKAVQGGCVNVAKIKTGTSVSSASVVNLVGQNLTVVGDYEMK